MEIIKYPARFEFDKLLQRPALDTQNLHESVSAILGEVKKHGDAALRRFGIEFDKVDLQHILVEEAEFLTADKLVTPDLKTAIRIARDNIEKFHRTQCGDVVRIETSPGVTCWRKSIGIGRVGLYIPGGTAPLFSTVLMLGIPAKLAGCREIILCTPPSADGSVNPVLLFTARLLGLDKVYKVGGVQAIGAMAYGTPSIPPVDKIFGPGNQYVTCAKQLVNREGTAIDMPAGPSELAILADSSAIPAFVAADLLSQAEHGPDSQVVLVSDKETLITEVLIEISRQQDRLPRKEIARAALGNSKAILVRNLEEGIGLLNEYAPEHLILACNKCDEMAEKVQNAGSVFLGNYSCESAGDYASGTNHALPTNGYARAYSGVSVDSFVKKITFQKLTKQGILGLGKAIELMAAAEGLEGHRNAVALRMKNY